MAFKIAGTDIKGCFELFPPVFRDKRGTFTKTFHRDEYAAHGLETDFREEYFSFSKKGVLRGLHFQTPPADHVKLVCCLEGEVLDAVVDLRRRGGSYGKWMVKKLSRKLGNVLYIPKGCAHGFLAVKPSLMLYMTSTVYAPASDTGILWNSAGIKWPVKKPLISERDASFAPFADFKTPWVK